MQRLGKHRPLRYRAIREPAPDYAKEALSLLIPPPVVVAILAAAMWLLPFRYEFPYQVPISILVACTGIFILVEAAWEFRRVKTTINPMTPEKSSALATRGVYAWSRNPIYLADAILLLAWAIYLGNPLSLAGIPLFVLYINRFQIAPEERALRKRFGEDFDRYCAAVRRWF